VSTPAQKEAAAPLSAASVAALESGYSHVAAQRDALVAVLWTLTNEVGGLDAFESEIRQAISNTNWECLKRRASDGREALARMGLTDDACRAIYRAALATGAA
jgi:hypothetical protein